MCEGIRFRVDVSQRPSSRGILMTAHFRLLKSRSCPGCPECEDLRRRVRQIGKGSNVAWPSIIKHGGVYRLHRI